MEGTGSYGAPLSRYLRRNGLAVIEVNRPDRAARRRHGKTDTVDAVAAAHAVLSGRASITAKTADGPVEMLRLFRLARDVVTAARHTLRRPAQRIHARVAATPRHRTGQRLRAARHRRR